MLTTDSALRKDVTSGKGDMQHQGGVGQMTNYTIKVNVSTDQPQADLSAIFQALAIHAQWGIDIFESWQDVAGLISRTKHLALRVSPECKGEVHFEESGK